MGGFFRDELVLEPLLQTAEVDVLHRPGALARAEERVLYCVLGPEADPADDLGDTPGFGAVIELLLLLTEHHDAVVVHAGLVVDRKLAYLYRDAAHLENVALADHDALDHARLRWLQLSGSAALCSTARPSRRISGPSASSRARGCRTGPPSKARSCIRICRLTRRCSSGSKPRTSFGFFRSIRSLCRASSTDSSDSTIVFFASLHW